MRTPLALLISLLALTGDALAQGKPELTEIDAWLVRDAQMSSQFAVADQLGYFTAEGIKVNPRWSIAGTDLPSMWGAGNIHTGTATATLAVRMAAWAPWVFNAVKQAGGKVYYTGNRSFIPGKEGQVDWLHVHAGVVASGKMLKENPNTLKAILRALRKATDTLNNDRDASVKIVAREMKTDEALTRDIMALNIYSMEMNEKIPRGMGEFVDFLHSLDRIKHKFPPESVIYTKLLEEIDPGLVKWKSKTEIK